MFFHYALLDRWDWCRLDNSGSDIFHLHNLFAPALHVNIARAMEVRFERRLIRNNNFDIEYRLIFFVDIMYP